VIALRSRFAASVVLLMLLVACGKKGPPLAPLRLIPAAMSEPTGRRTAQSVELRFGLPTTNANGPGTVDLDHVEIYAVTIGPGSVAPPNRELLTKAHVVGTIAVKPPPVEGEDTSDDKRPAPGDRVTFVEELTDAKMKPTPGLAAAAVGARGSGSGIRGESEGAGRGASTAKPETGEVQPATDPNAKPTVAAPPTQPTAAGAITPPGTKPEPGATTEAKTTSPETRPQTPDTATAPPSPALTVPTRIYVMRGISRGGRPGFPSPRISVALISPAVAPTNVAVRMPSQGVIHLDWTPPVAESGGAPFSFNVYHAGNTNTPMNTAPLSEISFDITAVEYGKEQCFVVRTVQVQATTTIESELSAPACLTPIDNFPPAAPKGLRAVAEDGAVNLVWELNTEPDLAGYLVLRGDASGGTLQPITPQPIKDASYRDTTVKPGVRYVYAVVAVDTATPRNTSAQSAPEAVTAR
jgi:predicted small lipoprotein YifL